MEITVDAAARRVLDGRQNQTLIVTIITSYGLPTETLSVEWCSRREAANDPQLTALGEERGVAIYAHRRIAAYARWHPLRITATGFRWWPSLTVVNGNAALKDLSRWERAHPGLRVLHRLPAA